MKACCVNTSAAGLPTPCYGNLQSGNSSFQSSQCPKRSWTIKICSGYYSYYFLLSNCGDWSTIGAVCEELVSVRMDKQLGHDSCVLWYLCRVCHCIHLRLPVPHPAASPLLQHSHQMQALSRGCRAHTQPLALQKGSVCLRGKQTLQNVLLNRRTHYTFYLRCSFAYYTDPK